MGPTRKKAAILFSVFLLMPIFAATRRQGNQPATSLATPINYRNAQYDFCVSLPEDWEGYSVIVGEWKGNLYNQWHGHDGYRAGPQITIRHPQWTSRNPHQDIPIMVFTHAQWRLVQKEQLIVTAAPVGPGELARNSKYVFSIPPRFNSGDLTGWKEVSELMSTRFFHAPCKR